MHHPGSFEDFRIKRRRFAAIVFVSSILAGHASAQQLIDSHLWITDGNVRCLEVSSDTVYLGGDFSYVGPATGAGVELSAIDAHVTLEPPSILGTVWDAAPDGQGGWYIAGEFAQVDGRPAENLVYLGADGSIEILPGADGPIRALALGGDLLYFGGDFDVAAGQARGQAAAINVKTGQLDPWNPIISGFTTCCQYGVEDILVTESAVILAGNFSEVSGQSRKNLAAVDPVTAIPTSWNPSPNFPLYAMSQLDDTLYLAGVFDKVGTTNRSFIAAVSLTSGTVTSWNPNSNGHVRAIAATPEAVYAGGTFSLMGGQSRLGAASIHPTSGALLSWNASLDVNSVHSMAVDSGVVYLGGDFNVVKGQPRIRLAAVDAVTANPTSWIAHAGGAVEAIHPSGDRVMVGGQLRSVGGVPRNFIAAIDRDSGEATDFDPDANGSVTDIKLVDGSLYVAGGFANIGGATRFYAAELDPITGAARAFSPPSIDIPPHNVLAITPDYVYVGGDFSKIGSKVQSSLAELDRKTGALTSRNVGTGGAIGFHVDALEFDSETNLLYVGGFFTSLAGSLRSGLGAINVATGTATSWNPDVLGFVQSMDLAGRNLYVGGDFVSIGDVDRLNAAAVDTSTGNVLAWNPSLSGGDGVRGTSLTMLAGTNAIYAGGSFSMVGGDFHLYAAALDPVSGALLRWDPKLFGDLELQTFGFVYEMGFTESGLLMGGDFSEALGDLRQGIATVTSLESVAGDVNGDGVVDLLDHSVMLNCLSGPGGPVDSECASADLDRDGDSDLVDWGLFQTLFGD